MRVIVRVKPGSKTDSTEWAVTNAKIASAGQAFTFGWFVCELDRVYDCLTPTQMIFSESIRETVMECAEGVNVSVVVCGQKNSGKSFTIEGSSSSSGIIPLSLNELFRGKVQRAAVSFFEVNNDAVRDLLSESERNLEVREEPAGVVVKDLTEKVATSFKEAINCLHSGKERKEGHRVFRVKVEGKNSLMASQLTFVELSGCEHYSSAKWYS